MVQPIDDTTLTAQDMYWMDKFAGLALVGLCSRSYGPDCENPNDDLEGELAHRAYAYAKAMTLERRDRWEDELNGTVEGETEDGVGTEEGGG